jgi:hypothetical protein
MATQINQISRLARQIANNPGKIRNTAAMKKRLILKSRHSLERPTGRWWRKFRAAADERSGQLARSRNFR